MEAERKTLSRYINSSYQPFVSVVIAAYNEEKVIAKTIHSILDSNYREFEVIVVDDGSTDGTSKVMKETFYKHPKFVSFRKKTAGNHRQ